jgi:cysteine desulfurase
VDECGIDLLTVSSNDLSGPPGVGALWIRPGTASPTPILLGGDQENGLRSGTPNLPAIVGMGVAADLVRSEWPREMDRLRGLRDRLLTEVPASVRGARVTGAAGPDRLPHHASFVVAGVTGDGVLRELDAAGIAASSGSVSAAATGGASHVLRAIGCTPREQQGAVCFTLGRWTTAADIDAVVAVLPPIVDRLRRLVPGP